MSSIAFHRSLALAIVAALFAMTPAGAANTKELQSVRGEVGIQATKDAPFERVFSKKIVADDQYAATHAASNGLVLLEDSSQVALGPNTRVQFGRFNGASATATQIVLDGGALRFDVRHPAGATSNYVFRTATSQIAVRGTKGLYSTDPNGDTVACLECGPGDVEVTDTKSGKKYALITGQTLFMSVLGAVTVAATSAAVLQGFSAGGLSTSATSTTAFASGVGTGVGTGAAAGAGAAGLGTAGIAAAAAAAAVAGTAIVNSSKSNSTPTPTPAASPTAVPGGVTLKGIRPSPTPSPSPVPPPHR